MPTLDELVVELRANHAALAADFSIMNRSLDDIARNTERTQKRVDSAFNAIGAKVRQIAASMGAAFTFDKLIDGARDMQNLQKRLEQTTGSIQNAAASMKLLRQIAAEQHVDLVQLADGYNRLLPAVKTGAVSFEEMTRILRLTNDNVRAMGLSTSDVQGLMLGLSQTLGSGTVSMEDLRQVTDRIPGSLAAMAKAMGTNVGGLKDMASKGQLTVEVIKGPLIEALSSAEGAAAKMGDTFDSASADMQNAFRELANTVAESGLFQVLTGGLQGAALAFQTVEVAILDLRKSYYELQQAFSASSPFTKLKEAADNFVNSPGLSGSLKDTLRRNGVGRIDQSGGFTLWKDAGDNAHQVQELKEATDAYEAALARLNKTSEMSAADFAKLGASLEGGGEGGVAVKPATSKAAKEAERLQDALDKLSRAGDLSLATKNMNDVEKATAEAEARIAELRAQYGKFTASQEAQAAAYIETARAAALLDKAQKQQEETAERIRRKEEEAFREQQRQAEEAARYAAQPWIHAAENVQDALADMLEHGRFSFESLADIAKKAAAEAAAAWIIRPTIQAAFNDNTPSGSAGSSGGLSINPVSSLSSMLAKTSVGSAINAAGASALPSLFGAGAPIAGGIGPAAPGLLTGMGLSAASVALPIAGLAAGFALKKIIGSFGSRPHPASTFGVDGAFTGPLDLQAKHMDTSFASSLADSLKGAFDALKTAGLDLSYIKSLQGGVNDGKGFLSFGDSSVNNPLDTVGFDPKNPDAGLAKFLTLVVRQAGDLSKVMDADLIPALRELSTEGKSSAEVIQQMVELLTRDDLRKAFNDNIQGRILEITDPLQARTDAINKEFDDLLTQAKSVGGDLAAVEELRQLTLQQQVGNTKLDEAKTLLQQQVEQATRMADQFDQLAASLQSFLGNTLLGADSALSPEEKLALAQGTYTDTLRRAKLGDTEAMGDLSGAAGTLLGLEREQYASGAAYKAVFAQIVADVQSVIETANRNAQNYRNQAAQGSAALGTPAAPSGGADMSALIATLQRLEKEQARTNQYIQGSTLTGEQRRA